MPAPQINWSPQGAGWQRPTYVPEEARLPSETRGWVPGPGLDWGYASALPHLTEAGGAMMSKGSAMSGMNGTNGMGDMFVYPEGSNPTQFYEQQLRSGAMPTPGQEVPLVVQGEQMEETHLFDRSAGAAVNAGSMSWEAGPAPWEQTALPNHMPGPTYPADAPREIAMIADAKAVQAAQAAKVAADNAVRAAQVGAPQVAATNAATAQAAASVAAQSAQSAQGHKAAAIAASEATKAVAAANVAANGKASGMGDWMTLSGLGASSLLEETFLGFKVKHIALLGAVTAGVVWGLPWLKTKLGK